MDLFISEESIGHVTGRVEVREGVLTLGVEAVSPRLAISGSGWVALTPEAEADLTFIVTNTSPGPLRPGVRASPVARDDRGRQWHDQRAG